MVAIGPHSAGTDGSHRVQAYIIGKLKSFGCPVDQEDFHTPSPIGNVAMENIVAKIPGASPGYRAPHNPLRQQAHAGFCGCQRWGIFDGRDAGDGSPALRSEECPDRSGLLSLMAKRPSISTGKIPTTRTAAAN